VNASISELKRSIKGGIGGSSKEGFFDKNQV
jgi:hypothetical protein